MKEKDWCGRDLALRQVPERHRSGALRLFEKPGSQKQLRRMFESLDVVTKLEWRESGELKKKCSESRSKVRFRISGPPSSCGFSRAAPSQSTPPSGLLQVQRRLFRVKRSTDRKLVSTRPCRSMLQCKMTGRQIAELETPQLFIHHSSWVANIRASSQFS